MHPLHIKLKLSKRVEENFSTKIEEPDLFSDILYHKHSFSMWMSVAAMHRALTRLGTFLSVCVKPLFSNGSIIIIIKV